jgi:bifunctional UDP-N-acetylglucosamine pyrophosphorylase / glucosamine-1-phosphate N-acetyltransferase
MQSQSDVTVVILAAGLGTRMKSKQAKVLHCAGGQTLIRHAVDAARSIAMPERIFVVVGHQADEVSRDVADRGVRFIRQTEQRGTGHALLCGSEDLAHLGGLLVIFYGDCPLILPSTLAQLVERQRNSGAAATLISTHLKDPAGYGRVIRVADSQDVAAIVEQKAATPQQLAMHEINAGIYCFEAGLFWDAIRELTPNNAANEYYLTDMVEILIQRAQRVQDFHVKDSSELLGINNRVDLAAADRVFRDRKVHQLMLDGVTIEKPETVTIDSQVQVGMDSIIEAFVQLRGNTVAGERCRIGACSIVSDSHLGDEVEIGPFTVVNKSMLEQGVHAGPFARLRMDNHVAANAHIGNFVELKKTRMGAGAKAGHLAYLGDSEIGAETNIGAGTITCNYDGVNKNVTRIGEKAFVGSNSTLVAPLEIAAGAYVAAGSVITKTVPEDALAIGRARQENKEGYARKLRKL